jgi:hypothetical protein
MKHPDTKPHTRPIVDEADLVEGLNACFPENFNPAASMRQEQSPPETNPLEHPQVQKAVSKLIMWAGVVAGLGLFIGFYLGMTWQKNADAIEIHEKKHEADRMIADNTARYAWVEMLNGNIEHIAKAAHSCHMANNPNTPGVVACGYIFKGIKDDAMAWPVFDENKLAMAHEDTPQEQDIARKGTASKFLTPEGGQ